eukprot:SAG22_NODE_84_length_21617_cov_48.600102_13_plen_101_part_00
MLLKAVITAFPCVSLPFLAVPLLSQPTVAIRGYWKALGKAAGGARGIVAAIAATAGGPHYHGEWQNDKRHGEGTMVWPDGRRFEGRWDNDVMVGGVKQEL